MLDWHCVAEPAAAGIELVPQPNFMEVQVARQAINKKGWMKPKHASVKNKTQPAGGVEFRSGAAAGAFKPPAGIQPAVPAFYSCRRRLRRTATLMHQLKRAAGAGVGQPCALAGTG